MLSGVRILIRGNHLPGRTCGRYDNVHVGLQVGRAPTGLVAADAAQAEWVVEVDTVDGDFRGAAVQGRRGERFLYLTWGSVTGGEFEMFRRAKLMLGEVPGDRNEVTVDVDLTDEAGMPRCARLRPPAIRYG
jgi:hypothetical protein